ncbi:MAG: nitronate monooxygenase [Betaproteobacteria bacterium]|nr:nitronate monooxygenase [Betaproteobacteria bacterium]
MDEAEFVRIHQTSTVTAPSARPYGRKNMSGPLHTPLCDKLGIEYPVVAFTHCKDVAVAVINAGGFAVLGEALHTPDQIAADIKWIRERINGKPFGIDLVLPSSVPEDKTVDDLLAMIPPAHREYERKIKENTTCPIQRSCPISTTGAGLTRSARWTRWK